MNRTQNGAAVGRTLGVAVLAFAAGLLAGWLVRGEEAAPDAPPSIERTPESVAPTQTPVLRGASESRLPSADPVTPTQPVASGGDASSKSVDARVARLAEQTRRQGRAIIDHAESSARARVATSIAAELAAREDLERGGTMGFLRGLEKDWTAPYELLGSPKEYAVLFEHKTTGGRVDGPTWTRDIELHDGDTISFPPGKHALDVRTLNHLTPWPKDLSIEGYGMDETLLVLNDEFRMRGDVHSLTFRDLTIHCGDNYLEAMRNAPYTLRVEDCRIIGFDMGAGGSTMLSGRVGAFYASGSRIEAGYGRSPGSGNLFRVRGAFLARLEDCVIVGPFKSVFERSRHAAQVFERCRFEDLWPGTKRSVESHGEQVSLRDCTFSYLPEDAPRRTKAKSLADINPAWK